MKPIPRVFLDASLLIAAAGSQTGASFLVVEICRQYKAKAVCSRPVLLEAERNIIGKMSRGALLRFYQQIGSLNLRLIDTPTKHEVVQQHQIIHPKDAHVLAAAVKAEVDFLLTLDRKHFMSAQILQAKLPFQIMTPGDFLRDRLKHQE